MPDTELQAGPEMDAAVAMAVGIHGGPKSSADPSFVRDMPLHCEPWSPSTDLNAAFEAAEKAGLLVDDPKDSDDYGRFLTKASINGKWLVASAYYNGDGYAISEIACGSTPAEAICRAILALHKNHS